MKPSDLGPILHADHSLTLTEGVNFRSAPGGQYSGGADSATGLADETVYLRRAHLAQLARAVDVAPGDISFDELMVWIGGRSWSRETRRTHRSSYRSFFAFVGRHDIAAAIPRVKPSLPHPQPIPEGDLAVGLDDADDRTRLILRLASELGLRRGEISRIHSTDLTRARDGWVLLVHGKGGKVRVVPVPDGLAAMMRIRCEPGGWLFPGGQSGHMSAAWVGKLASRALPGVWTVHKLRHRFATAVHAQTHDLVVVQQLLGHASLTTTQLYVATSTERLRAAVVNIAA